MKENFINWLIKVFKADTNQISDGYHTFKQLYDHRIGLWIALCREYQLRSGNIDFPFPERLSVWKTKKHSDGTVWNGWFILGMGSKKGEQITYHLPEILWNKLGDIYTLKKAPKYDGHTPADALFRISEL
jgi:hypothetical protein